MGGVHVSIIVPVYNVECYLEQCLKSILQQSFENYELLCVDDGSTDNSGKILKEYALKYNRIKVITHEKNLGLSAARNTGLKYANGKYVMFVDSDDFIEKNALEELFCIAEEAQVDIVYFNIKWSDDIENKTKIDVEPHYWYGYNGIYSGKELFTLFADNHQMKVEACRQFIRKKFLEDKKIKFYDQILHEDILFSFLCAMNAEKVIDINKEYYIQRYRKDSITHTKDYRRVQSLFVIMIQILTYWNSHIFSERENRAIEKYFQNIYDTYKNISWFGENNGELEIGGYVEKSLYSIIYKEYTNKWLTLSEEQLAEIEKAENIVVFGAGLAAKDIINILKKRNIGIDAIAVSDLDSNPPVFCGVKVVAIDNIINHVDKAVIILGVTEKYHTGVRKKLEELGYHNIIIPKKVVDF